MQKVHIVINLDELTKQAKEDLLNALYHVEDQMCYKCKSVSKTINALQKDLFENEE